VSGETAGQQSAVSSQQNAAEVAPVDGVIDGQTEARINEYEGSTVRVKEAAGLTRISFEFKDANAATQIRIAGDTAYDYKYVVMPLRI